MIINPKHAIQEGWITGIKNEDKQVQPNAIDFTLDRLFVNLSNDFILYELEGQEIKIMRGASETFPIPDRKSNIEFFHLHRRTSYDAMSDVYVKIPEGVTALLFIRSTFNRNGIFLTSGIYDSGFEGNIGIALHNISNGLAKIQKGMRVGQIMFIQADNAGIYTGKYNTAQGQHWSEKK